MEKDHQTDPKGGEESIYLVMREGREREREERR